ncbi:hypothetical protein [Mucilaginibacter sp.]
MIEVFLFQTAIEQGTGEIKRSTEIRIIEMVLPALVIGIPAIGRHPQQ